ncbi:facilitated trehalose transporter Tret1 isoform X1 [Plutella xylostella]|uniref:facilitated trehalose transporter Tret1 isoform X1 n=2 Tax=Plutella xylostella TaxID=51655 RepID=UPI0020321B2A|nr:facilitated trehalose transporter Tret1 isoform X1 [Plutella xylostella]
MKNPMYKQILYAFALWCHQFQIGFIYGLQGLLILNFRKPGSLIHLTAAQESWIPAITTLVLFPTRVVAGVLTTRYGRKWILVLLVMPNLITVVTLYFAYDFTMLISAYLICGFSGAASAVQSIAIAECCSPRIRGTLLDIKYTMVVFGFGAARLSEKFFDWRHLILISILPLLVTLTIMILSHDSPAWLASQGRFQECTKAFNWFRGEEEKEELDKLIEWQDRVITKKSADRSGKLRRIAKVLMDKGFLKATMITCACLLFYDMTGRIPVIAYLDILNSITKDPANVNYYAFLIDMCDLLGLSLSAILVKKMRRRTLVFGLGIPTLLMLYTFCGISYISYLNLLPARLSWLPFTVMVVYFFMINACALGTFFTIQSEVYPLAFRGVGIAVAGFVFTLSTFIIVKMTPTFLKSVGVHGLFSIFAIILSLIMLFLYFYLPETFNKTLQNIEVELKDVGGNDLTSNVEANEKMLINK